MWRAVYAGNERVSFLLESVFHNCLHTAPTSTHDGRSVVSWACQILTFQAQFLKQNTFDYVAYTRRSAISQYPVKRS